LAERVFVLAAVFVLFARADFLVFGVLAFDFLPSIFLLRVFLLRGFLLPGFLLPASLLARFVPEAPVAAAAVAFIVVP
jgi:hypothetical protein